MLEKKIIEIHLYSSVGLEKISRESSKKMFLKKLEIIPLVVLQKKFFLFNILENLSSKVMIRYSQLHLVCL